MTISLQSGSSVTSATLLNTINSLVVQVNSAVSGASIPLFTGQIIKIPDVQDALNALIVKINAAVLTAGGTYVIPLVVVRGLANLLDAVNALILQTNTAIASIVVAPVYPASVVANGLQTVWDLRVGGSATPGPRSATTKTIGVDNLPGGSPTSGTNCSLSGGVLIITGNQTFSNWNFKAVANTGGVVVRGNSTTATFNDCVFGPQANNPAVNDTQFYGIQVSDNSTAPTVHLNYCKFDGGKYQSNNGVSGPWSGSAVYALTGATVVADHCWFTGIGYDVVKETNSTYTQTNCLIQAYGWNQNSDADGVQQISGTIDVENCLYDIRDGGAASLGVAFPGQAPNSGLFCTIDTPSTGDGAVTAKNNIWVGYGGYTLQSGYPNNTPFNVVSVADNHTDETNGFHIKNGVWQNNVIEKGNQGWWTYGGTESSVVSIATWTTNIDFNTSATIPLPVFGATTPTWALATFGAAGKVESGATLTASQSPAKVMIAFNYNAGSATNGGSLFVGQDFNHFSIRIVGSADNLRVLFAGTGASDCNVDLVDALSTAGEQRIVIVVDTTAASAVAGGIVAYANDTAFTLSQTAWAQNAPTNLGIEDQWCIGSSSQYGDGTPKLKWLWFDYGNQAGTYPDFTVQANRDKLKTGTLLSDGSNVTGVAPLVFFGGSALSAWTTPVNQAGTAGNPWAKSGSIT